MSSPVPAAAESRRSHDHARCIRKGLRRAETLCTERGLRLTPIRRRVLEQVLARHAPVGAYDVLQSLAAEGTHWAPPTVYRALEFLLEAGLIHRIDALNAFIACESPEHAHSGQFLVCTRCHRVDELSDPKLSRLLAARAREAGFSAVLPGIEIKGICSRCQDAPAPGR